MQSYVQRSTIPDQKGGGYSPGSGTGSGTGGSPRGPESPQSYEYSEGSEASGSDVASDSVHLSQTTIRRGREEKVTTTPWRKPRGKSLETHKTPAATPWRKPRERSLDSRVEGKPDQIQEKPPTPGKKIPPWARKQGKQKLETLLSIDDDKKKPDATDSQKPKAEQAVPTDAGIPFPAQRKPSIPWTEEQIKLKKTVTEKKPMDKEKLETVQLKPIQTTDDRSKPKTRSSSLAGEDTLAEEDSGQKSIQDQRRRSSTTIPWTEEPIKLKKTVTEKKAVAKEKLETVKLKPVKDTNEAGKEGPDFPIDSTDMPEEVTRKSKIVPWTQEEIKLKKPTIQQPKELYSGQKPDKHRDSPLETSIQDATQTIETMTKEQVKPSPQEQSKAPRKEPVKGVPWAQEAIKLEKPKVVEKPDDSSQPTEKETDQPKDVQEATDKRAKVPWTQEKIQLKKTVAEKKVVEREKLETVQLKSRKASLPAEKPTEESPEETRIDEAPKPSGATSEPKGISAQKLPTEKPSDEIPKTDTPKSKMMKPTPLGEKESTAEIYDAEQTKLKTQPIPWTQEQVRLKKTTVEKKTIVKEKLDTVQLKPTSKAEAITVGKETEETRPPEKQELLDAPKTPGQKTDELSIADKNAKSGEASDKRGPQLPDKGPSMQKPQQGQIEQPETAKPEGKKNLKEQDSDVHEKDSRVHPLAKPDSQPTTKKQKELRTKETERRTREEEQETVREETRVDQLKITKADVEQSTEHSETKVQLGLKKSTVEKTQREAHEHPTIVHEDSAGGTLPKATKPEKPGEKDLAKAPDTSEQETKDEVQEKSKPDKIKRSEEGSTSGKPKVMPWTQEQVKLKKVTVDKDQRPEKLKEKRPSLREDEIKPWTEESITLKSTTQKRGKLIEEEDTRKNVTEEKASISTEEKETLDSEELLERVKKVEVKEEAGKPKKPTLAPGDRTMMKISIALKEKPEEETARKTEENK
ncbi:unnamed protein product, partial [Nesidiocoris tenuis]